MISIELVHEKLSVGQIFKNFNYLCNTLGEDAKRGTSRDAQINNFERFFDFDTIEKGKHPLIIKEIYDVPKPIIDGRSQGANAKYIQNIEIILLNYIKTKSKDNTISLYRVELLLLLGMVNNRFENDSFYDYLIKKDVASQKQITDWENLANQVTHKILFRVLDSMQNRKIIEYKSELLYVLDDVNHVGSKDDIMFYKEIDKQVRDELGHKYNKVFNSVFQLYPKYNQEYYKILNNKIFDIKGWSKIRQPYKIRVISSNFNNVIIDKNKLQICKSDINKKVLKAINNKILQNYKSLKDKHDEEIALKNKNMLFGKVPEESSKLYYTVFESDYVERLKGLTDKLIRI